MTFYTQQSLFFCCKVLIGLECTNCIRKRTVVKWGHFPSLTGALMCSTFTFSTEEMKGFKEAQGTRELVH